MSLIEAMVWIALTTAIMLALVSSLLYFYRTNTYAIQEANAIASGQRGIDLMVRTLREMSYSATGGYPILAIGTTTITFYADINANSSIEKVTYRLQGKSLLQDIVEPTGNPVLYVATTTTALVSDYIHNTDQNTSVFTYYDKNGTQINDYTKTADVRFISVSLVVDVDTQHLPSQLILRSSATPRNLVGH